MAAIDLDRSAQERWNDRPRPAYHTISVRPIGAALGAEVSGIDWTRPLPVEQIAEIRTAIGDNLVLVFRDQPLDRAAHKQFGRAFGTLHCHALARNRAGDQDFDPEVLAWKTDRNSRYTAGEGWHADVTCDANPIWLSMLRITRLPECGGGDTLFANMHLAWDLLSAPLQTMLLGLDAVHDGALPWTQAYGVAPPQGQDFARNTHPVVARHPYTGRPYLNVNSGFTTAIVGLQPAESSALLQMLFRHVESLVQIHNRIGWSPDTMVVWDNRAVQHRAVWDYYPHQRWGERVSVLIDQPPQRWSAATAADSVEQAALVG